MPCTNGSAGAFLLLHALNYCTLLPGPEAHKLAVYVGWLLHRIRGGLVAGILFILPGLVALGLLSWIYATYGNVGIVQALFFGLKAAVLAVVLEAVLRVGLRALSSRALVAVAAFSFVAIFFFSVPFPIIIAAAALIGLIGNKVGARGFSGGSAGAAAEGDGTPAALDAAFAIEIPEHVQPSARRTLKVAAVCLTAWLAPLTILLLTAGPNDVYTRIAFFFTKMSAVTFGGCPNRNWRRYGCVCYDDWKPTLSIWWRSVAAW